MTLSLTPAVLQKGELGRGFPVGMPQTQKSAEKKGWAERCPGKGADTAKPKPKARAGPRAHLPGVSMRRTPARPVAQSQIQTQAGVTGHNEVPFQVSDWSP